MVRPLSDRQPTFDSRLEALARNVGKLRNEVRALNLTSSWGAIAGTLSAQTDLQAALDAKQASGSYAAATHTHTIDNVTGLQTALDAKLDDSQLSTDGTLSGNSDTEFPSEKAVKTYVDTEISSVSVITPGWNHAVGMVREWYGDTSTAASRIGFPVNASTGSFPSVTLSNTNRCSISPRFDFSTTTANTVVGYRWDAGGTNQFARDYGFKYEAIVGWLTGATMSQKRLCVGMRADDNFPSGTTEASAILNWTGMGADSGDANWQLMSNDGSGTATKHDTGWVKTVGETFHVIVEGNSSQIVVTAYKWAANNFTPTPTDSFSRTFTTDIPAGTTGLAPSMFGGSGATAEATVFSGIWQRLRTPV